MEVDYDNESDGDTIMNDSDSIASSISIEDDAMDGNEDDEMTGILAAYDIQQTVTIHLVQAADGSWTRTVE